MWNNWNLKLSFKFRSLSSLDFRYSCKDPCGDEKISWGSFPVGKISYINEEYIYLIHIFKTSKRWHLIAYTNKKNSKLLFDKYLKVNCTFVTVSELIAFLKNTFNLRKQHLQNYNCQCQVKFLLLDWFLKYFYTLKSFVLKIFLLLFVLYYINFTLNHMLK